MSGSVIEIILGFAGLWVSYAFWSDFDEIRFWRTLSVLIAASSVAAFVFAALLWSKP
jgi:hypothetical protein